MKSLILVLMIIIQSIVLATDINNCTELQNYIKAYNNNTVSDASLIQDINCSSIPLPAISNYKQF